MDKGEDETFHVRQGCGYRDTWIELSGRGELVAMDAYLVLSIRNEVRGYLLGVRVVPKDHLSRTV